MELRDNLLNYATKTEPIDNIYRAPAVPKTVFEGESKVVAAMPANVTAVKTTPADQPTNPAGVIDATSSTASNQTTESNPDQRS